MLTKEDIEGAIYYQRQGDCLITEQTGESAHLIEGRVAGVRCFKDKPTTPYGLFLSSLHISGVEGKDTPPLVCLLLTREEAEAVIPGIENTRNYVRARFRIYVANNFAPLDVSFFRKYKGYGLYTKVKSPTDVAAPLGDVVASVNMGLFGNKV